MDEKTLDKYLRNLKFIVLADAKTSKPIEIFFGFHYPNFHLDIFEEAKKQYANDGKEYCVHGGGRITKKDNFIVFHSTSNRYKRYEDDVVLALAKKHPIFKGKKFVFLSKAGEENFNKVIEDYNKIFNNINNILK